MMHIDTYHKFVVPVPEAGCWLWTGNIMVSGGYGRIPKRPKHLRAHRVSYEQNVGSIPKDKQVLHHCDTPSCVNPAHLYLGDDVDNKRDMVARGRQAREFTLPQTKLSFKDRADIRVSAESVADIARQYGVSKQRVYSLRTGSQK